MPLSFRRISCAVAALTTAVSPLVAGASAAQDYQTPSPQQERQSGNNGGLSRDDQDATPPADNDAPPAGYDGTQPPPPPTGYQADSSNDAQRTQDQRYEANAEEWSQQNCVKSRGNTTAGAVIGGLFGAVLGSSIAGRHDRGAGAVIGGVAGAVGGAAIANADSNATSPGCPPGYVVRNGAPAFYYGADEGPYYYAAPGWYRPWVYYGGRWTYRPYPYHTWYYRHYHGGSHRYYRGGYYHRGGYHHRGH